MPRFSIRRLLLVTTLVALGLGFLPWFHDFSLRYACVAAIAGQLLFEAVLWTYAFAMRLVSEPSQSEESADSD